MGFKDTGTSLSEMWVPTLLEKILKVRNLCILIVADVEATTRIVVLIETYCNHIFKVYLFEISSKVFRNNGLNHREFFLAPPLMILLLL